MRARSTLDAILIDCVVKGYHTCGFTVTASETFFLEKKIGSRGETFRVVSCKGQLGKIQFIPRSPEHSLIGCLYPALVLVIFGVLSFVSFSTDRGPAFPDRFSLKLK